VLKCVGAGCSVLTLVAVCCNVLRCIIQSKQEGFPTTQQMCVHRFNLFNVAVCCIVLQQTVVVCCSASSKVSTSSPPKNGEITLSSNTRVVKCKYHVSQKQMGSIITTSGTMFYSLLYFNSRIGLHRLNICTQ